MAALNLKQHMITVYIHLSQERSFSGVKVTFKSFVGTTTVMLVIAFYAL